MEARRYLPPKEAEAQRGGKQVRVMQTRSFSKGAIVDMRGDQQKKVLAWALSLVLDGAPFRCLNQGIPTGQGWICG